MFSRRKTTNINQTERSKSHEIKCKIKHKAKRVAFSFLGTMELVVNVDDEGVISLNFECPNLNPESKFIWSKNYEEIGDSNRLTMETKGNK